MTPLLLATLLVLNKGDSNLVFVDPATLQVIAKVPTGNAPHEVATSTDGRIAFVTNYGTGPEPGDTISIISIAERTELKRMRLPALRPHGTFAIGSHIYFTAEASHVVGRYDVTAGAIDWMHGTDAEVTHMLVVTPDEKKIYTANIGSNSVGVIDLPNSPRVRLITVGKGPEGIDLSPDGKEIWVAHRGDGALTIIDTSADKVVQTIAMGTKMANRVKFTRDGKRVLVSDPPSNALLVYDAVSRQLIKKLDTEAGPEGILIAPDGKRAFIACSGAGKVAVLDLDALTFTGSVATGKDPDGMAWAAP